MTIFEDIQKMKRKKATMKPYEYTVSLWFRQSSISRVASENFYTLLFQILMNQKQQLKEHTLNLNQRICNSNIKIQDAEVIRKNDEEEVLKSGQINTKDHWSMKLIDCSDIQVNIEERQKFIFEIDKQ